ncbi:MAG: hypothetical protein AAF358_19795 [Pseudomonadota bacterium]
MNDISENKQKFLPAWVWTIVFVQVFLVLFFSVGTALNPGDFIPGVNEINYVVQLYLTRNVTAVLGIVIALFLRSHQALFTILVVRVLTDLSDIISVYVLNVEDIKESVPMVVALLVIPALVALSYLWRRMKAAS